MVYKIHSTPFYLRIITFLLLSDIRAAAALDTAGRAPHSASPLHIAFTIIQFMQKRLLYAMEAEQILQRPWDTRNYVSNICTIIIIPD